MGHPFVSSWRRSFNFKIHHSHNFFNLWFCSSLSICHISSIKVLPTVLSSSPYCTYRSEKEKLHHIILFQSLTLSCFILRHSKETPPHNVIQFIYKTLKFALRKDYPHSSMTRSLVEKIQKFFLQTSDLPEPSIVPLDLCSLFSTQSLDPDVHLPFLPPTSSINVDLSRLKQYQRIQWLLLLQQLFHQSTLNRKEKVMDCFFDHCFLQISKAKLPNPSVTDLVFQALKAKPSIELDRFIKDSLFSKLALGKSKKREINSPIYNLILQRSLHQLTIGPSILLYSLSRKKNLALPEKIYNDLLKKWLCGRQNELSLLLIQDMLACGNHISAENMELVLKCFISSGNTPLFLKLVELIGTRNAPCLEFLDSSRIPILCSDLILQHLVTLKQKNRIHAVYYQLLQEWGGHNSAIAKGISLKSLPVRVYMGIHNGEMENVTSLLQILIDQAPICNVLSRRKATDTALIMPSIDGLKIYINELLKKSQGYEDVILYLRHFFFRGPTKDYYYQDFLLVTFKEIYNLKPAKEAWNFIRALCSQEKWHPLHSFFMGALKIMIERGHMDQAERLHKFLLWHTKELIDKQSVPLIDSMKDFHEKLILLLIEGYIKKATRMARLSSKRSKAISDQFALRSLKLFSSLNDTNAFSKEGDLRAKQSFLHYFILRGRFSNSFDLLHDIIQHQQCTTKTFNLALLLTKKYINFRALSGKRFRRRIRMRKISKKFNLDSSSSQWLTLNMRQFTIRCYEEILQSVNMGKYIYSSSPFTQNLFESKSAIIPLNNAVGEKGIHFHGKYFKLRNTLDAMAKVKLKPNVFTCNLVLSFLLRYSYTERAWSLFQTMQSAPFFQPNSSHILSPPKRILSLQPDVFTYHLLISYFSDRFSSKSYETVLFLYRQIRNNSLLHPLRLTLCYVYGMAKWHKDEVVLYQTSQDFIKFGYLLPTSKELKSLKRRWKAWLGRIK